MTQLKLFNTEKHKVKYKTKLDYLLDQITDKNKHEEISFDYDSNEPVKNAREVLKSRNEL